MSVCCNVPLDGLEGSELSSDENRTLKLSCGTAGFPILGLAGTRRFSKTSGSRIASHVKA